MIWYSPKYYAELRRLRRLQAASDKQQAPEATSDKPQAPRPLLPSEDKKSPQASSDKQQAS